MSRELLRVPLDYQWDGDEPEPPKGDGYQIWERVSEGSPISPVFEKPEDLANWMVENDTSISNDATYEQWMKLITVKHYAPSMIITANGIKSSVGSL